jgi:ABC-type sugar transport system substrate-binding protein
MSEDGSMTLDDLEMVEEFLEEQGMDRGDLLRWAAALGLGAAGFGLAAGKAGAAPLGETLQKRVGWIISVNVPFYELSMTRWMRRALRGTGYRLVTQSEDGNNTRGLQIMANMIQQNYAIIFKSDGAPGRSVEPLARQARQKGIFFISHSVQPVGGAGQNVVFDHGAAGNGIGSAAVAWAKRNGITKPVIGTLAFLSDAQGVKRTSFAIDTITKAFPNTEVAGQVESVNQTGTGAAGTANLLQANPEINMILTFNTVTGKESVQAAMEAGKTDRNKFFIGMADYEPETMDLIASRNSIVQANWGALFEISAVLMIRDALASTRGRDVFPTRGLGGILMTNKNSVDRFRRIANNPLARSALPAYRNPRLVIYSRTPLKSGQSIDDIR